MERDSGPLSCISTMRSLLEGGSAGGLSASLPAVNSIASRSSSASSRRGAWRQRKRFAGSACLLRRQRFRTQLVRTGEDELAHEALHGPAVFDEFGRQIVEQLRVRWSIAIDAEVVDGLDDAFAEQVTAKCG